MTEDLISCKICFKPMDGEATNIPVVVLPCAHRFCELCIIDWCGNKSETCPMCRIPVQNIVRDVDFASLARIVSASHGNIKLEYDVKMTRSFDTHEYGFRFQNTDAGIMVTHIENQSPAFCSGLMCGDIITKYNGIGVSNQSELVQLLRLGMSTVYFKLAQRYKVQTTDISQFQCEAIDDHLGVVSSNGEIKAGDFIVGCNSKCGKPMIDFLRQCGLVTFDKNLPHFLRPRIIRRSHATLTLLVRHNITGMSRS